MAALTEARDTVQKEGTLFLLPVKAGATIHQGACLVFDGGGVKPAVKAENLVFAGIAEESAAVASGGSDGDATVLTRLPPVMAKWKNDSGTNAIVAGDVGKKAYIADDQTVTDTATGSSDVGVIYAVESDGIWVKH